MADVAEGLELKKLREALDERRWIANSDIGETLRFMYCRCCNKYYDHEQGEINHRPSCAVGIIASFPTSSYEQEADILNRLVTAAEGVGRRRRDAGMNKGPYSVPMKDMDALYDLICEIGDFREKRKEHGAS